MCLCLVSLRSTLCTMFTVQHFFSVIPQEMAAQRYATQGARLATHDFCRGLVMAAVSAALESTRGEAPVPAIPRRPGHPQGSLNVQIFIQGLVNKIVEATCLYVVYECGGYVSCKANQPESTRKYLHSTRENQEVTGCKQGAPRKNNLHPERTEK